jgi:stage V sporulation protein AA
MAEDPVTVPSLYVRFRKRITISKGEPVKLGQVAELLTEPELTQQISELVLYHPEEEDGNLLLADMMQVTKLVKAIVPHMNIVHFGEPHALIEVAEPERKCHPVLITGVWLLLFIGSGLAIMNFHEDVSMPEVHLRIYELLTGERPEHPYWLQIPYSFGIGIGMVLFFNHLFKKKFNEEPSPLEVEMYLYQQNMNQYVVAEEYSKRLSGEGRKPHEHDSC